MKYDIKRNFSHRTHGQIGEVMMSAEVASVSIGGKVLPDTSVEYLLNFALQSLQDAYAGAEGQDDAKGLFAKKLDALVAGTIGVRTGGGASVSDETRVARQIVKTVLKGQLDADAFKALTDERLDEVFAKNKAKLQPMVDERLTELKRERERKAKLGKGLEISL